MKNITIIIFSGLTFIVGIYFVVKNPTQSDSASLIRNAAVLQNKMPARSGVPVRLMIPKINLVVAIEQVGITPDGAMDVPKNRNNAGWFSLGVRPGEIGSAAIAGHYGFLKNNIPAIFNNIGKLKKGDKLYVVDENGTTTAFVVRESREYDPKADASGVFASNDGKAHLNLITCEGTWVSALKTYTKRLVIFTDKEG